MSPNEIFDLTLPELDEWTQQHNRLDRRYKRRKHG
nr:MAG TPA: hypothetical protein [Caudoviricetes sp.]